MNKLCPVCGKFTFELFKEETDNKRNGACNNCGFYYIKKLNDKTYDEQIKDWKIELAIMSIEK